MKIKQYATRQHTKFCILILYPETWLNVFISPKSVFGEFLGFLYIILKDADSGHHYFLFSEVLINYSKKQIRKHRWIKIKKEKPFLSQQFYTYKSQKKMDWKGTKIKILLQ